MEATQIMNNFIANELSNKVYHLTKALNNAQSAIETLEKENQILHDALANLVSEKKEDYKLSGETSDGCSFTTAT